MPNYKGHLAGGIVLYGLIVVCFVPTIISSTFFEWLAFVCAGALFPDVDTKSKGQKLFFGLVALILLVLLFQQRLHAAALLAIASCVPLLVHHRGIFHNMVFLTIFIGSVGFFIAYLMPAYKTIIMYDTLFFWIGVFSHVWLDRGLKRIF